MQTFDKLYLSEASDIAFAGEIAVMVSASSIPKLSNLFFIFLSPFVSVFWTVSVRVIPNLFRNLFLFLTDPETSSG